MSSSSAPLLVEKPVTKRRYSPRWRVIGHDDDVTPMDYVVMVLIDIFNKTPEAAYELMMEVHETGSSSFYFGTREACELKLEQVKDCNQGHGEALSVSMEPIEDEDH
jgi:ATP-dependent Clp protease adaptor protein ClpS